MFICMLWVRKISYIQFMADTSTQVHNDNKPLEMILKKPIHTAPYKAYKDCYYVYKNTITLYSTSQEKKMVLADNLSHFPSRKENMPIELHQSIQNIYFTPDKFNIVRGAVERDPIHNTVYRFDLE